jgi:hypothetical protein
MEDIINWCLPSSNIMPDGRERREEKRRKGVKVARREWKKRKKGRMRLMCFTSDVQIHDDSN